jgi:hypothetical protein
VREAAQRTSETQEHLALLRGVVSRGPMMGAEAALSVQRAQRHTGHAWRAVRSMECSWQRSGADGPADCHLRGNSFNRRKGPTGQVAATPPGPTPSRPPRTAWDGVYQAIDVQANCQVSHEGSLKGFHSTWAPEVSSARGWGGSRGVELDGQQLGGGGGRVFTRGGVGGLSAERLWGACRGTCASRW